MQSFTVVDANIVGNWLKSNFTLLFELMKNTYLDHADGIAINPDSYFLRFPDEPNNRIIALPAFLETKTPVSGIKWISSFPDNINKGLDRASAVMIVNDRHTGYPIACLEGSQISAARTAASAAIGAKYLHHSPGYVRSLAIVGCGLIAKASLDMLLGLGWEISQVLLYDTDAERGRLFAEKYKDIGIPFYVATLPDALQQSDMILFTTSSSIPYIVDPELFSHAPTILHMSLRDLGTQVILAGQNVADDVDHCLKSQTSLHLTYLETGDTTFIAGGVAELIREGIRPDFDRPRIYSPFGMGVLDLAVAQQILSDQSNALKVNGFFPVPYVN
ncbi:TPA: 2,3-diaminopropionate biosynthesis protein SbnB [Serratia fonticola]